MFFDLPAYVMICVTNICAVCVWCCNVVRVYSVERLFVSNLPLDMTTEYENVDDFANNVTNALYECAATSRCAQDVQNVDNNLGRWERLMGDKDDARIWRSINWRGELGVNYNEDQ